jgi:hypothetical protein
MEGTIRFPPNDPDFSTSAPGANIPSTGLFEAADGARLIKGNGEFEITGSSVVLSKSYG